MKSVAIGIIVLFVSGCAIANDTTPALGVKVTDGNKGWLLFTDRNPTSRSDHIFILSVGKQQHAVCCGKLLSRIETTNTDNKSYTNVESEEQTNQYIFHITVPKNSIRPDVSTAIAVWNASDVVPSKSGYAIFQHGKRIPYRLTYCFGQEGMNTYLWSSQDNTKKLAHYYTDFGYAIAGNDCKG